MNNRKPTAVIIGIGPGNGAAISRQFAEQGYNVAMISRSTTLSSQLAASFDHAKAYAADANHPDSIVAALDAVVLEYGSVDTLVYNAGAGSWAKATDTRLDDFESSWRVNALSALAAAQAVAPAMVSEGHGNIVFIGATASLRGGLNTTGFAAGKAAQRSMAQSLSKELSPKGVHVALVIIDGQVDAEAVAGQQLDDKLNPHDIAHAIFQITRQPTSAQSFQVELRPKNESW
ncbi:SDR family NAD(P)-dependent oxidoreductase [Marinobacter caseinilyticus]|uniref:SDR family NAD(P)-dependent oxidoreductase n=1 Tax=Marinobacter caseinilyticus TaxID=2692195 RepID=UPI00140C4179|nr:SDR family NAD(P)-dependent oxidoreductase [Marinobacter caseinilyticus]